MKVSGVPSLHRGSLKITRTVSLTVRLKLAEVVEGGVAGEEH